MRPFREVMRLKYEAGLGHRAIARACSVGVGTVSEYVRRAGRAGLGWALPGELDDAALEARLFPVPRVGPGSVERVVPDCATLHQELRRPGVTLQLLWLEYREVHPEGYQYSQFCERYRRFAKKLSPSMRQVHRAGEKAFVDFSGKKPVLIDRQTGEIIPVELFVGVLGASGLIYAEATLSQDLPSWIAAHVRMLEWFGGAPEIFVPDNLRSAVTASCRYEPTVNRTYADFAAHYGAVVVPARVYRPKDKAKVELSVLLAQRWILAVLRNRTFFSLGELNAAIRERLTVLNARPMQKLGVSRRELFLCLDKPALKALPRDRYEMAQWKDCRVNIDYHVEIDCNYYSVPYQLVRERVEVRFTHSTVEIFYKSRRVASHVRLSGRGQPSTTREHMPSSHRAHAEWTPSRVIAWAEKTGPGTARVVTDILESRRHPEQGFRSCMGIIRLGEIHGRARVEAACVRAERLGSCRYSTVKNILKAGLEQRALDEDAPPPSTPPVHDNIRGPVYYQ
jgi:transposase